MKDKFLQCHFIRIRTKEQCVLIKAQQILIWVTLVLNYSPVSNTHNSRPAGFWEPVRPSRVPRPCVYLPPARESDGALFAEATPALPPFQPRSPPRSADRGGVTPPCLPHFLSRRRADCFPRPSCVSCRSLRRTGCTHERLAKLLVDSKYS